MQFSHSRELRSEFPQLVAGALAVRGISAEVDMQPRLIPFMATADARLAGGTEAELPEIQAWRRAFASMGLKPTQYRCAAESLLRRYRKERALPQIHPLIDLCNAVSLAFAIPVAVFDVARIAGDLEVRHATGSEVYDAFSGEEEHPAPGEVVFADRDGRAHARRWTNRQSRYSAVSAETTSVLIVAEALHETAGADVPELIAVLTEELDAVWSARSSAKLLTDASPRFELDAL